MNTQEQSARFRLWLRLEYGENIGEFDRAIMQAALAEIDQLQAEQDALKNKINAIVNAVEQANEKIQAEVTRMEAELETVLKDRIALAKEVDELRAKLATLEAEKAEREKQEPICHVDIGHLREISNGNIMPIYAEPTAGKGLQPLYLYAGAKE
jgi:septal ring factor EnvC (AmiA/AmiB activator)